MEDSEVSHFLETIIDPVRKKNKRTRPVKVHLLMNRQFNAFAIDKPVIFLHVGVIERNDLGGLVSVLLHEMGHIAGHHVFKMKDSQREGLKKGLASTALACILGGVTGSLVPVLAGLDVMMMGATSSMMRHSRDHEYFADAFAVRALRDNGWPTGVFLDLMKEMSLRDSPNYPAYLRTHPFSLDRLAAAKRVGNHEGCFPQSMREGFDKIKMKILAYCLPLDQVMARVQNASVKEAFKDYGCAIVAYRSGQLDKALSHLEKFECSSGGRSPYTEELRAQILLEKRQLDKALIAIQSSCESHPRDIHFALLKARILFEMGRFKELVSLLESHAQEHRKNYDLWYWLGKGYDGLGRRERSCICQGEGAVLVGQYDLAMKCIRRAGNLAAEDPYSIRRQELSDYVNGKRGEKSL